MDFALSDTQQMLADMAGRFLRDGLPFEERLRVAGSPPGYSPELWRMGAELGLIAALFDEGAGGFGGTGGDIALIFRELGQVLATQPFLETLIAGRIVAASASHSDAVGRLLGGDMLAVPALYEPQARYDLDDVATRAVFERGRWHLTGDKAVVRFGGQADAFVVPARTTGDRLEAFLVPADARGVSIHDYGLIDGGRGGELSLRDVALDGEARLRFDRPASDVICGAVAAGLVGLCAEAVGIMDFVRETTLEYLRTRVQFGRPLGSFQALRHRMADLAVEIEQARSATINAAARLDGDPGAREAAVSAAKYTIDRVATLVSEEAIQLHGGIGMTWELPVSHYAKRLTMIGHQYGDEDHHLDRYIALRSVSRASPPPLLASIKQ